MHCCGECRGKCCKESIFVTYADIQKLGEKASILELRPFGSGFMIINKNGCPFFKR